MYANVFPAGQQQPTGIYLNQRRSAALTQTSIYEPQVSLHCTPDAMKKNLN